MLTQFKQECNYTQAQVQCTGDRNLDVKISLILAKLLKDKFIIRDIFNVKFLQFLRTCIFVYGILDKNRQYFNLKNIL